MTYNRDKFVQVMMSVEDKKAYYEWVDLFHKTYHTRQHKGFLTQVLHDGTHSIKDLELKNKLNTHTKSKVYGAVGLNHASVIEQMNEIYSFENLKDKSKFKMPLSELNLIITKTFPSCTHRTTINNRRNEIYSIESLEQIKENGKWFVVHESYNNEDTIKSKVEDKFSYESITNEIIKRIENKGSVGLAKAFILNGLRETAEKYVLNFDKLRGLLFRKIDIHKNIKEIKVDEIERFVIYTKQDEVKEINKDLEDVFGDFE